MSKIGVVAERILESKYRNEDKEVLHDVAMQVIRGKWSSGQERIDRLKDAGYNAEAVQLTVMKILRG